LDNINTIGAYNLNRRGDKILELVNRIFAENLKKLRETKKLSLENVAKLSGVSKSMLCQIERGEVNPTISTVWKIANGLKVSFTALMSRPEAEIEIVNQSDIQCLIEDDGKYRNYPIFPFNDDRRFEMYMLEIEPEGRLRAEAHPEGTQEFITVFAGEIAVEVDKKKYRVTKGNSIRFKADEPHAYYNTGGEQANLSMVIYYPK
jgi:transcriptional regulator with XRE-family HTH domain